MKWICKEYNCGRNADWILERELLGSPKMLCDSDFQKVKDNLVIFLRETEHTETIGSHYRKLNNREV